MLKVYRHYLIITLTMNYYESFMCWETIFHSSVPKDLQIFFLLCRLCSIQVLRYCFLMLPAVAIAVNVCSKEPLLLVIVDLSLVD